MAPDDETHPPPIVQPREVSRWANTKLFRSDESTLQRAKASSPLDDTRPSEELPANLIPQLPPPIQSRQSNLLALGQERLGGMADFQQRPAHRPTHSATLQMADHPSASTQRERRTSQLPENVGVRHQMHHSNVHYVQWPATMTSGRRASTGNWRSEVQQEPHTHAVHQRVQPISHDILPMSPFFPLPYTPTEGQLPRRRSHDVEGTVGGQPSYATALKHNASAQSLLPMGHHGRGVEWHPIGWSEKQAWPALGAAEKYSSQRNEPLRAHHRNPSDKPLLRVETSMKSGGYKSGSSSGSASSDNSGRKIDLGGFKPSRMKEEQRGIIAAPTGSNYLGKKQSRQQSPRNKDDPNEDNCALWLTDLPTDLTLRDFLALVNTGEVFATVFSQPKPPTWTQAVKLVFKAHEAASRFLGRVQSSQGIVLNGIRMEGTWNRNWYPEDKSDKTRVLQIECPIELTSDFWHSYFNECVIYQVEEELEMTCDDSEKHILEFRFARIDGQSEALYQAISKNPKFHGIRYRYAADPCNPTAGQRQN
ncbi:hypothetical protein HYALB_00013545 [Hymenoscyphus albidus]|uniref:RRM domain-containing protein n=1 Tax=Hymenoscyphus albidus TaxID=595503 RepID=A0A9N9QAX0_9HELO|nr:hypothetical protein HYALB_00013545 [Hymenoscyphus albidus]